MRPNPALVKFLESVLYGKRRDPVAVCARFVLAVFSIVYRALVLFHPLPYQTGLRRRRRLETPVISVGNLTVGGTGKSPTVQYLCKGLVRRGWNPAALSYGYGGSLHGRFGIVADTSGVRLTPETAGDEPVMLAASLPGVAVLICKDREKSGRSAIRELGANIMVLDDGFQVWNLERNLDVVLLNAGNPFDNGRTLPAGRLREPLSALKRAGCIMAVGVWKPEEQDAMLTKVHKVTSAPVYFGKFVPSAVVSLKKGMAMPLHSIRDKRVFALSTIANPGAFEDSIVETGAVIFGRERLPDHHLYSARDISRINRSAMDSGADFIVTTDKDAVKLDADRLDLPVMVLRIELKLDDEAGFWKLVAGKTGEPPEVEL
jgi:tetraacyldisaccharide 4'-kinase